MPMRETGPPNRNLKVITMNIEGLYTRNRKDKLRQLLEVATTEDVAAIAVTESHLREKFRSAEVKILGF